MNRTWKKIILGGELLVSGSVGYVVNKHGDRTRYLKLTFSPLKIRLPNRKLVFQPSIFRGYVSFREGKSPKDRVVGPLPNGRTSWLINGGDPITTCKSWDDPPSWGVKHRSCQQRW